MTLLHISTTAYNKILELNDGAFSKHKLSLNEEGLCITITFETDRDKMLFELTYGELIGISDSKFDLLIDVQKIWKSIMH